MSIAGRKVAVVLALLAIIGFAFGSLVGYAASNDEQVKDEFRKAINAFEEGDYAAAKLHFAAVLNLNPSKELAAQLRNEATLNYLMEIAAKEEIGPDVWRLINLASAFDQEQRRNPEVIKALVADLNKELETRQYAMAKLVQVGAFAIPQLVPHLADPNEGDGMRTYAYITVQKMGREAVQPLIELLNSKDPLLVQNACMILASIGDARAIPYLLRVAKDEKINSATRETAAFAFAKLAQTPIEQAKPLDIYFYNEALRYYLNSPIVQEEAFSAENVVWRWNAESQNVVAVETPEFAYNEEVARDRCFAGLDAAPASPLFTPLLVCLGISESIDVRTRVATLRTQLEKTEDDDVKTELQMSLMALVPHMEKASRFEGISYLVGQQNLFAALDIALKNDRYADAAAIIKCISEVSDGSMLPAPAEGEYERTPGAPLIDALDSKHAMVRYSAAICLGTINPPAPFAGSAKVAQVLAAAMADTADINVLCVDDEIDAMNALVETARKAGFSAEGAFSGRACIEKAGIFPIKDIIVLDYALGSEGDVTVDEVYRKLKAQAHTRNIPVLFVVPDTMVGEFQTKFPDAEYYVTKPVDNVAFANMLNKVKSEKVVESPVRAEINSFARNAAATIAGIDLKNTQIDVKSALKELVAAFNSSIDEVRVGAMKTVANLKAAEALEALKEVFKNTSNSSVVRITSLEAIGAIDPAAAKDLLTEAVGDKDAEIAKAAAIALGKKDFPAEEINKLIRKSLGQ
ncbi:MAG: hypothetical protein Kow00107_04390 [Planctomycetota bacterium]